MAFAAVWAHVVKTYSQAQIEVCGAFLVQAVFFWLPSCVYLLLDSIAPAFSQRHKLQPAPKQPSAQDIRHCALVVVRNQAISFVLQLGLIWAAQSAGKPSSYRLHSALPGPSEIVRDFVLSLVMREALFYYSHRILHHPRLYAKIHKKHHRFTAPVALAAQYAHPIEHIVANVLPIALPPQILRSHILTFWIFLSFELIETSTVHSGYDFFHGQAKMHDLHHEKFNINFGSLGFLDRLHGTDRMLPKARSA